MSAEALAAVAPYAPYLSRDIEAVAGDLDRYAALLTKWQAAQNLVSRETLNALWTRHVGDSLQVLKLLTPTDRHLLDLGSGGGFPAIPLAIARQGTGGTFTLIEANQRKVSFLRAVARDLRLEVKVIAARIDEIDSRETIRPDVITSRALASLTALCAYAAPFFGPNTRAIFHKGREYSEELVESRAVWQFDVIVVPSDTSTDGVLLELRDLCAKPTT